MAAVLPLWKWVALFFIVLSLGLLVALIVIATKDGSGEEVKTSSQTQVCGAKQTQASVSILSSSPGLFDDLRPDEMNNVYKYMLSVKSLNLKSNDESQMSDNYITLIKFYPPPKDEALAYLDEGKQKPERQAIVVVFKGAAKPPVVEEYLVGPVSKPTKHELLEVNGRSYPINFNSRPGLSPKEEMEFYNTIIIPLATKLHRLFHESYDGYTLINCTDKCLMHTFSAPYGMRSEIRENWYLLLRNEIVVFSHPLNFEFYVNHAGTDSSKWRIEKLLYNGQLFNSTQQLMDAYDNGRLHKTFIPAPKGNDKLFSTYEKRGKQQPSKPSRGPEQYEPDGKRYSVKGRHIEYMNWAFDFRVDSTSGPQVYDVRFGGERIAYEISLQEAIATYTGYYPTQTSIYFLDSTYMMGFNSHDLVQGTDCPGTATFFDLAHMVYTDTPQVIKNGACVFELNSGTPLRRHYDNDFKGGYTFYGGMVNQVGPMPICDYVTAA